MSHVGQNMSRQKEGKPRPGRFSRTVDLADGSGFQLSRTFPFFRFDTPRGFVTVCLLLLQEEDADRFCKRQRRVGSYTLFQEQEKKRRHAMF